MLSGASIAGLLERPDDGDPLVVAPQPNLVELRESGAAALDLRLGTWFLIPKRGSMNMLRVKHRIPNLPSAGSRRSETYDGDGSTEVQELREPTWTDSRYVPPGKSFVLHPRSFVLAVTLEWIRMTTQHAAYVTGKSSWGRRGLVIETAPGVHPGFSGCLTLELANVGEVPLELVPGIRICQLFIHSLEGRGDSSGRGRFVGRRQPAVGQIETDEFVERLKKHGCEPT